MNYIKEKMKNFRNGENKLDNYLQEERQKNKYDPRQDLSEDHKYWQAVLKEAEKKDRQVYCNLHGFRIAGCRLKTDGNTLKMIPGKALGEHWETKKEWVKDRSRYLLPYKELIKAIFEETMKIIT